MIEIWNKFLENFPVAIVETLYMSLVSTFFGTIFGMILAILLFVSSKNSLKPNAKLYRVLDALTNTIRSFPFIILIVAIEPITHFIAGSSIGTSAVIIPLTIGVTPFMARLFESSFNDVDKGLIEASKSFGASNFQIIFRIVLIESLPNLITNITLSIIVVIGFSAMAGVVGGGGIGAVAINRGYNGFDNEILYLSVIVLLVVVQFFQSLGNYLYKITKK